MTSSSIWPFVVLLPPRDSSGVAVAGWRPRTQPASARAILIATVEERVAGPQGLTATPRAPWGSVAAQVGAPASGGRQRTRATRVAPTYP